MLLRAARRIGSSSGAVAAAAAATKAVSAAAATHHQARFASGGGIASYFGKASSSGGGAAALEDGGSVTPLLESFGETRPKVFMDFEMGRGNGIGRVVVELAADVTPKAAENFLALCTGEYAQIGKPEGSGRERSLKLGDLHYLNTPIHRVLPGFMVQGGDNENYDGTGGYCVFEGMKYFEDESYSEEFLEPGIVGMFASPQRKKKRRRKTKYNVQQQQQHKKKTAMASSAPDRNASQFFITTVAAPHLKGRCVAVGRVVEGMDVVERIEAADTDHQDKPLKHIRISSCGKV